jgi:hypothetical protein
MRISLLFWILMLLWLLFGFVLYCGAANGGGMSIGLVGGNLLLFVVIGLLGWKVFGSPLRE